MNKKTLIYETAVKIFAKNGFDKTSVDDIAESAKIAKGTIYYHFKSKDEIFLGLIENGINDLIDEIRRSVASIDDPRAKLETMLTVQLNFYQKYRDFCKVLVSEFSHLDTVWKKDIKKIQAEYHELIKSIIDKGKQQNQFREDLDSEAITIALFSLIAVAGLSWALLHREISIKTMHSNIISIFLNGIIA